MYFAVSKKGKGVRRQMMETREQMKRLMEKIQMPEEGIAQLLEAREQLE